MCLVPYSFIICKNYGNVAGFLKKKALNELNLLVERCCLKIICWVLCEMYIMLKNRMLYWRWVNILKKCGVGRRFAYTRMLIFHVTQDVINEYSNVPGVGCRQNRSFFVFIKLAWAQLITATAQPVGIVDRKIKEWSRWRSFRLYLYFWRTKY